MKFLRGLKKVHILFILAVAVFSLALVSAVQAVTAAEPGSDEDPIVTQSYVDGKIAELTDRVEVLSKQLEDASKNSKFEAVQVKAGKQLVAGASTEIVLRSGKANAVASANGGVSDLISGVDLATGKAITLNHLLLIPRDDGRGFKAVTDVWILIKGEYTVK